MALVHELFDTPSYKHKNTLKTMIGISPNGLVTYISNGGCTSERQIIERSDLCKKELFNKQDSILAGRGIMVQNLFVTKDVQCLKENQS